MTPYYEHAGITIYHGDCREILPTLPKCDLLLTDPPYGINADSEMHKQGGQQYGNTAAPKRIYADTSWDTKPADTRLLLSMVGSVRFAIIFGGNYFALPATRCVLVWDKENGTNAFADAELAWSNLDKPVRIKRHMWNGMLREGQEERFGHPTQKPVEVMQWCITQAPDDCKTILDPFMGSGTTLVAAKNLGRKAIGIEIEEKYIKIAIRRLEQEVLPFEYEEPRTSVQGRLLAAMEDEKPASEVAPLLYLPDGVLPARATEKV
jgi:hypothetical protein